MEDDSAFHTATTNCFYKKDNFVVSFLQLEILCEGNVQSYLFVCENSDLYKYYFDLLECILGFRFSMFKSISFEIHISILISDFDYPYKQETCFSFTISFVKTDSYWYFFQFFVSCSVHHHTTTVFSGYSFYHRPFKKTVRQQVILTNFFDGIYIIDVSMIYHHRKYLFVQFSRMIYFVIGLRNTVQCDGTSNTSSTCTKSPRN